MANTSSTQFKDQNKQGMENKDLTSTAKTGNDLRNTVGDIVGGDNVQKIVDRAQEGVQAVKERATQVAGQIQDAAGDYVESANQYVRRHPIQSVLVGVGVGLLLGALLSPKRFA